MILTIIRLALLIAVVVLQVAIILQGDHVARTSLNGAVDALERYCTKHACDDCKFQKNEYCVLSDPPCDWRRKLRGEDE